MAEKFEDKLIRIYREKRFQYAREVFPGASMELTESKQLNTTSGSQEIDYK